MKVLCIGDLHYKVRNAKESILLSANLLTIAKKERPDLIVVMGDTLHTNNVVRTEPWKEACDLLIGLKDVADVVMVIGNHDIPGPRHFLSQQHPFYLLHHIDNMTVADYPITKTFKEKTFTFCPYVEPGRFREALDKCDWRTSSAIFCHQEFKGCTLGSSESLIGDYISEEYPFIVAGHIHEHQYIYQDQNKRVVYVGTPRQVDINESLNKTVSLMTFNEDGTVNEKRILTELPPRMTKKIRATELSEVILPDNGEVHLQIVGTFQENQIAKRSAEVRKWIKNGFTIGYIEVEIRKKIEYTETNRTYIDICREKIGDSADLLQLLEEIFS